MNSRIFLTGFMGSGKTFWGKIWAKENHLNFFDLDQQVEKKTGQSVAKIFEKKGEDYFREIERYELREFLLETNFILACGGGTPCFFDNLQWMNDHGTTVYLRASAKEILDRITNEIQDRPLLNKVNQSELLFFIEQKLKEREPFYKQAKYIFNVGELSEKSLPGLPGKLEEL
ncbi:MAG: shikimate kinase [Ginsengibacter sp.]